MFNDFRLMAAATIASGLVSKHGIDHGGISPELVAERSLAITDAIYSKIEIEPFQVPAETPAPAPIGNPGDSGSVAQPVQPAAAPAPENESEPAVDHE